MGAETDVAGGADAATAAAAEQERKTLADLVARGAEWLAERVLMLNRAGAMIEARMTEYAQELAKKDLEPYKALLNAESVDYWSDQLIANRAEALQALQDLAGTRVQPQAGAGAGERKPMHNRATARPVQPADLGGGGGAGPEKVRAAKLRNRAMEIASAEGVPFSEGFRRAEREAGEKG